jgi:hypothetical protein
MDQSGNTTIILQGSYHNSTQNAQKKLRAPRQFTFNVHLRLLPLFPNVALTINPYVPADVSVPVD